MTLYTAVDVARFCAVDLKTIHKYAARGVLAHHKTAGRHLRFHRLDVIDFLRAYGHAVPAKLRAVTPRVVLACRNETLVTMTRRALAKKVDLVVHEDPFDALIGLATSGAEAFALDVGLLPASAACFVRLRAHPATRHLRLLAIAETDARKADLLAAGARELTLGTDASGLRSAIERAVEVASSG